MKNVFLFFIAFMFYSLNSEAQERIDSAILEEIREQAFRYSRVMDIAFYLTDVCGPRLSNSLGLKRAQDWSVAAMKEWGMVNVKFEPWGTFGRGWEVEKAYLALKEPYYQAIPVYPKAWTKGSGGVFTTQLFLYNPKDSVGQAEMRGELRGKLLLIPAYNDLTLPNVIVHRYSDSDLYQISNPVPDIESRPQLHHPVKENISRISKSQFSPIVDQETFCNEEGVLGIIQSKSNNKNGTVFVQSGGPRELARSIGPMQLMLSIEDHQRLQRLLTNGIPVTLEGDIICEAVETDSVGYNVVGEILGVDNQLKTQLVMLGAHLDSWQGATGATDNAAGTSVMLEVMRILEAMHVRPRRTIRIILWSGEEEGMLGSRGYIHMHNGELGRISAYYNLDNGTGKIRGIYLQGDSLAGPIFGQWLSSFKDLGATTVTIRNTGGTDHLSFAEVGVPGFQFIQDPIDYEDRTHHSNMDNYDHLLPQDLKQAACIIAAFVYQTAMRDAPIPRKL